MTRAGHSLGAEGHSSELIAEREHEVQVLAAAVDDARHGRGNVVLIEGAAGSGKSTLLMTGAQLAADAGVLLVTGRATELEVDLPFGVAIQMFEPHWVRADASRRQRLIEGPARWAGELLDEGPRAVEWTSSDQAFAMIHSLFWLTLNLVRITSEQEDGGPIAIIVDDAHWADEASLRFLAYLAPRVADTPITLIVAFREGSQLAEPAALEAIRTSAHQTVLRPAALTPAAVGSMVRGIFPESDEPFRQACRRLTGGNPFLLTELLEQVRSDGLTPDARTASELGHLTPESVVNAVVARLGALGGDVASVASAVAILGDGSSLRHAAALARIDLEAATRAADALAASHFIAPSLPLAFRHPMIAAAIRASMSPLDCARSHRRAATILDASGAPAEQVAVQLLAASPEGDARSVEILRAAAGRAGSRGATRSAARMLERALAEPPDSEMRCEVLADLGEAEAAAGLPGAAQRLREAISTTNNDGRRGRLSLMLVQALQGRGEFHEAAEVAAAELGNLTAHDSPEAVDLQAAYAASASFVPGLATEMPRLRQELLARSAEHPTRMQRQAIAQLAVGAALRGDNHESVVALVKRVWPGRAVSAHEGPRGWTWRVLLEALVLVDELELALELCAETEAAAREDQSPALFAAASFGRAWALLNQGRVFEALADAQAAFAASPDDSGVYAGESRLVIASCHLQRGDLERAEGSLSSLGPTSASCRPVTPVILDLRARVHLARLQGKQALAEAREAGRLLEAHFPGAGPGAVAWRSTAALAHLGLGEVGAACELAAEELELARRAGNTRVIIRDLRVLGLAQGGTSGLDRLEEAATVGRRHPPRLEYVHALLDLGAALRRANRRADARAPLHQALALARRGGLTIIEERASAELRATGARPRKQMRSGFAALTPSEHRVSRLAASGLSTRQVAETLFVTPKTVEFHLGNIYRKLDVRSREGLARALDEETASAA